MSLVSVRTLLGAAAILAASFSSHATLIVNGDFEENFVASNKWSVFNSADVAGWQGSNVEIWNALNGVVAASGNNFIELNSHGSNAGAWSIFQTFATEVGRQYELSFYYRARNNNNEAFEVSFAGLSQQLTDHTKAGWTLFTSIFTATDSSSTLSFTSLNSGTQGNLIDNVNVTAVPEPATLAAFGAGLLALVGGRRLRRNKAKAS
ncbi:PEP-CTERM protein-sorting domain-containing protein [Arsukibacterium tuosuense]|uniref:PEP-CTERM protein-sorting domain-containing protein n=1 Tax=Arsukibacterium tuosuense TaxID=1323745 RepID=A0A285JFA6_9GAMM|nr:DUF642 domain-containing protein [Arsukibacterium tuosuense]SNY58958.1 PEP-CTERM protein-sorting domain-containing protein [Arsukibacterium tuosuense]